MRYLVLSLLLAATALAGGLTIIKDGTPEWTAERIRQGWTLTGGVWTPPPLPPQPDPVPQYVYTPTIILSNGVWFTGLDGHVYSLDVSNGVSSITQIGSDLTITGAQAKIVANVPVVAAKVSALKALKNSPEWAKFETNRVQYATHQAQYYGLTNNLTAAQVKVTEKMQAQMDDLFTMVKQLKAMIKDLADNQ